MILPNDSYLIQLGVNKRASKKVYRMYKINRDTLELLASIYVYLKKKGKTAAARPRMLKHYLINPLFAEKVIRCWNSLVNGKYIEKRYWGVRKYEQWYITDKGKYVLELYIKSVQEEIDKKI